MTPSSHIAPGIREAAAKAMHGERILWAGRPKAIWAAILWLPLWAIAVPWTGISLSAALAVYEAEVSGIRLPGAAPGEIGRMLACMPFLFVIGGLYMLLAPFAAWRRARRTVHVVSERHFAILDTGVPARTKAYERSSILRTERTEDRRGAGTLTLALGTRTKGGTAIEEKTVTLRGVSEVRKVERLLVPAPGPH